MREKESFMAYDDYGWPKYVSVAEKRAKADKSIARLVKKYGAVSPVVIEGRTIARSWWGKAWISNLERYADYANRIGRGRSYVRNGAVLDLRIEKGRVGALVQGSSRDPYEIEIRIKPLAPNVWKTVKETCAGRLESLPDLLDGRIPEDLAHIFTSAGNGLFPSPREIGFDCSCPDYASMCKHVAAVLYGIGARFDKDPLLFFVLRNVDVNDLVSRSIALSGESLLAKAGRKSGRVIESADLSAIFGIELGGTNITETADESTHEKRPTRPLKKSPAKEKKKNSEKNEKRSTKNSKKTGSRAKKTKKKRSRSVPIERKDASRKKVRAKKGTGSRDN
jgi:uncharacterized Zn finger protein